MFDVIIANLNKKIKKGMKLKPYDQGYNSGVKCAISKLTSYPTLDYRSAINMLRSELSYGWSNRDDGFDTGIKCAMSMLHNAIKYGDN